MASLRKQVMPLSELLDLKMNLGFLIFSDSSDSKNTVNVDILKWGLSLRRKLSFIFLTKGLSRSEDAISRADAAAAAARGESRSRLSQSSSPLPLL
jgi:hypothetical protein